MIPGGGSSTCELSSVVDHCGFRHDPSIRLRLPVNEIILIVVGVSFTALCVWLSVRIMNRRERWTRWTLALVLSAPAFYLASFGPVCWWMGTIVEEVEGGPRFGNNATYVSKLYWPIGWTVERFPSLRPFFAAYSHLLGNRSAVLLPVKGTGAEGTILWVQGSDR